MRQLHLEKAMDVDADQMIYRILKLGERAARHMVREIRSRRETAMVTSRERIAHQVGKSFVPARNVDATLRVATALEYIAVQLGAIAVTVARIEARLEHREPSHAEQDLTPEGLDLFSHHSE